jgi:hypothetical protein
LLLLLLLELLLLSSQRRLIRLVPSQSVQMWVSGLQISWATIAGGVVESTTECSLQEVTDRGFAHDAPKYTFLNPHITPHFLAKRQQFTKTDIKIDRGGVHSAVHLGGSVLAHLRWEHAEG